MHVSSIRDTEPVASPALRELWRQRARLLASNVATDGREHREIAHAAALIGQDYHDRFLIELIQNANDQAVLANLQNSTIVIVRTRRLLAVSNGGQAVTRRNLERLSSLADSDKTGLLVGNKGVGFKAVYQLTDMPEVFSAAEGTPGNVFENFGLGIALAQRPFENKALLAAIEKDVRDFFIENEGLARSLSARTTDPVDAVRPEFTRVAGFKFPLPRSHRDLVDRLRELRLSARDVESMSTLVVLPLRNERADQDVGNAIDLLIGSSNNDPGQAELALLFLRGVANVTIIDHVRDSRWEFSRALGNVDQPISEATISMTASGGTTRARRYWLLQRDAITSVPELADARRLVVADALREFGLEAWQPDDPLPVTVAIPMPADGPPLPLGPPGRFCLGLPTQQSTGLPAHVDARFFATISRTALDFGLDYNALLLDVATVLFGELLRYLQSRTEIRDRRAATLALHRTSGVLADRVFSQNGPAHGPVVLAWDGKRYLDIRTCQMPNAKERTLLSLLRDAISPRSEIPQGLPEEELLQNTAPILESLGLRPLTGNPHPWLLDRDEVRTSSIERAAKKHRADGPRFWEPFAHALLDCFGDDEDIQRHAWLPVGTVELAAPCDQAFLPFPVDSKNDDEEVANVPPRVAAMIRLVDGSAMRLREDGRTLTPLAQRLVDSRVARRPRKVELLEEALFPALETAAQEDTNLAVELFGQALSWIASMRDVSRQKLNCTRVRVPTHGSEQAIAWKEAANCYFGEGWGLSAAHERLLADAYPGFCLLPLSTLQRSLGTTSGETAEWRGALDVMGVRTQPRIRSLQSRGAPLEGQNGHLTVVGTPTLQDAELDRIYRPYIEFVARFGTTWSNRFAHDIDHLYWIDGLEDPDRREHVLDLMLMYPEAYLSHASVHLQRAQRRTVRDVPSMWVFALARLGWPLLPGERGASRQPVRVSARHLWRLPEGSRRTGYVQLITVVPRRLDGASHLLRAIEVPSIEDAPVARLVDALTDLAERLDTEKLHTRPEALSLASELYTRLDERLEAEATSEISVKTALPFLRDRRLEAIDPRQETTVIVFDDDPARGRHVSTLDHAGRVPIARDTAANRLYEMFARTWGSERVVRTSTIEVQLEFVPASTPVNFLTWLRREFPHIQVANELAALLTFGGERSVRVEQVSRHWKTFEGLTLIFGSFGDASVRGFYDRPSNQLWLASWLQEYEVVEMTWELAGARSRDVWASYARALEKGATREFLRDREIDDIDILKVADAAGLHNVIGITNLAAALQAAHAFLVPSTTLEDAGKWLASVGDSPEDIANAFGRPELVAILNAAIEMPPPEGELHIARHFGLPWALWQEAVLRRDGERYVFLNSAKRYRDVLEHLAAVARDIAIRGSGVDLSALHSALVAIVAAPAPEAVRFLPFDVADSDGTAFRDIQHGLARFDPVARSIMTLGPPPWPEDLPIPSEATRRGVRLFREFPAWAREIEATTSVKAVLEVARLLGTPLGEQIDSEAILRNADLSIRSRGEWSNVYAALVALRRLLEPSAPQTVKRLSSVQAFRESITFSALIAQLPEIQESSHSGRRVEKHSVLGVELTAAEITADLASGSAGLLGAKLASAARVGLAATVLQGTRSPLPPTAKRGRQMSGGSSWGSETRKEPALIGDVGEAFVHEWLRATLGDEYGAESWVSSARERYGLPPSGSDSEGYDFKLATLPERVFGVSLGTTFIEVKSTATDGSRPFPMSQAEWEQARVSHETGKSSYVILRVFQTDSEPRIGDVIIDPFAAYKRREIRLADRDLWVTVSPRQ